MNALRVVPGGQLGQYHHAAHTGAVSANDVENELRHRGYDEQQHVAYHHPAPAAPTYTLSKHAAVVVAVDEGITILRIPHTAAHPYRCPTGQCAVTSSQWRSLINWCVQVANGYLAGQYRLPSWAQSMIHSGQLRGLGSANLNGWLQENPWVVQSFGDAISNYGDYLTAKDVQNAIQQVEKNTRGTITKGDIPALLAQLQAGGYIKPGQEGTVAAGASAAAASPSWLMPVMILGGVAVVAMLMRK